MEHITPIFMAAFAVALIVLYGWGKAVKAFQEYTEYKKLEKQKRFHRSRISAFISASQDVQSVIDKMNTQMPASRRQESLGYADFKDIHEIQSAIDRVVDSAMTLKYTFQNDLGIASENSSPVVKIPHEEADRLWEQSFQRVKEKINEITRYQYRKELEKLGIFSAQQLAQAGPILIEKRVVKILIDKK